MSTTTVVVRGTMNADGTLKLEAPVAFPPGPVQVTIQALSEQSPAGPGWWDVLQQIWREQAERGYQGRSLEEMEADEAALRAEDEEYEARWRTLWSQTEPSSSAREMP
jgi:hypothetical protein